MNEPKEVYLMSPDEYFVILEEKYGDDFNWIRTSSDSFVAELKHELGNGCSLNSITAIAKCESNDNVLFLIDRSYRIYHLTYSGKIDLPEFLEFANLSEAMDFIENDYVENYL